MNRTASGERTSTVATPSPGPEKLPSYARNDTGASSATSVVKISSSRVRIPTPLALSPAARQHLYERDHGSDYQRRRCRPASPKWVEIAPRGKHRRIDQPTRQPRPSLTALLVARRAGGEQHECGREGPRSRLGRQPAVTQPPPSALLRRGLRKGPRRSALLGQRLQSTPPELQKANGRRSTAFSPGLLA